MIPWIQQIQKGIWQIKKGILQIEKGIWQIEKSIRQIEKGIRQIERWESKRDRFPFKTNVEFPIEHIFYIIVELTGTLPAFAKYSDDHWTILPFEWTNGVSSPGRTPVETWQFC